MSSLGYTTVEDSSAFLRSPTGQQLPGPIGDDTVHPTIIASTAMRSWVLPWERCQIQGAVVLLENPPGPSVLGAAGWSGSGPGRVCITKRLFPSGNPQLPSVLGSAGWFWHQGASPGELRWMPGSPLGRLGLPLGRQTPPTPPPTPRTRQDPPIDRCGHTRVSPSPPGHGAKSCEATKQ
jgi:hypothetical protein